MINSTSIAWRMVYAFNQGFDVETCYKYESINNNQPQNVTQTWQDRGFVLHLWSGHVIILHNVW